MTARFGPAVLRRLCLRSPAHVESVALDFRKKNRTLHLFLVPVLWRMHDMWMQAAGDTCRAVIFQFGSDGKTDDRHPAVCLAAARLLALRRFRAKRAPIRRRAATRGNAYA